MGITGLLPFVKNACRKGNIRELRGKSVAIDVSCLLHRGLTGCMDKIHMGEETQSYINYVDKYIQELLGMECHVVMVFDGRPLPAKKSTNDDRREMREKRKEHAEMLLAKGKEREARDHYRLATTISAEIVEKTIDFFRKIRNVDVVVAPYEADAQLAYLMQSKLVDAVVTEDSDLIVFGCETIYFKWQSVTGDCSVYQKSDLKKCFSGELGGEKFDFVKFRRICILAGCDYLQSGLPGVGLATAVKFFSLTSIKDLRTLLRKIPSYLKNPKLKEHVNEEFIRGFERAENTFKHQIVFDPRERCQKPLTPYPAMDIDDELEILDFESPAESKSEISTKFEYAGTAETQRSSIRLALGNPSNNSKNSIDDRFLLIQPIPEWSIWGLRYESKGQEMEKLAKKKEEEAMECGGAFKLDSPSVVQKRPKIPGKIDKIDESDDIVAQFMAEIEKEKQAMKKRKNAPASDYSAENVLKKYAEPVKKRQKVLEVVDDDFSELFELKVPEKAKKVEILEKSPEKSAENELKPPPILRKSTSTPESSRKFQKFQSPLLSHQTSAPPAPKGSDSTENAEKTGISKYFSRKTAENGPSKTKNPFRCPAFIKSESKIEGKIEEQPKTQEKTVLSALEENCTATYRFVGFKSAGLRRKPKN
ncbi:hypothetical protein L5515_005377 [Caenorhabditis briggsae]|uniref:Exonuclease 1 n=1 Tax=Caenorhabditis briggsae TaxID=6238 RepID=A0AAE9EN84_CAEBR|nr:hypothetical protein L5515_005377 [Caenorhabditis briggsae]